MVSELNRETESGTWCPLSSISSKFDIKERRNAKYLFFFKELSYAILGQAKWIIETIRAKVFDCVWIDSFKIIKAH